MQSLANSFTTFSVFISFSIQIVNVLCTVTDLQPYHSASFTFASFAIKHPSFGYTLFFFNQLSSNQCESDKSNINRHIITQSIDHDCSEIEELRQVNRPMAALVPTTARSNRPTRLCSPSLQKPAIGEVC